MKKFRDEADSKKLEIIDAIACGLPVDVSLSGDGIWHPIQYPKGYLTVIVLDAYYRIPGQQEIAA